MIQRDRAAGSRSVQVDDVERPRSLVRPPQRGVNRLVRVDRLALEIALREPYRPAVHDVDRREENDPGRRGRAAVAHEGAPTEEQTAAKFPNSRSPCVLDFSGWN